MSGTARKHDSPSQQDSRIIFEAPRRPYVFIYCINTLVQNWLKLQTLHYVTINQFILRCSKHRKILQQDLHFVLCNFLFRKLTTLDVSLMWPPYYVFISLISSKERTESSCVFLQLCECWLSIAFETNHDQEDGQTGYEGVIARRRNTVPLAYGRRRPDGQRTRTLRWKTCHFVRLIQKLHLGNKKLSSLDSIYEKSRGKKCPGL
jgi:hypothetical protein